MVSSESIKHERQKGSPHFVDVHVGARITHARKLRGLSQTQLADALGVSFQQVQKYEKGSNRVSASMMYEIMRSLNLSATYFFQGVIEEYIGNGDRNISPEMPPEIEQFARSEAGSAAIKGLIDAHPKVRSAIMNLLADMHIRDNYT